MTHEEKIRTVESILDSVNAKDIAKYIVDTYPQFDCTEFSVAHNKVMLSVENIISDMESDSRFTLSNNYLEKVESVEEDECILYMSDFDHYCYGMTPTEISKILSCDFDCSDDYFRKVDGKLKSSDFLSDFAPNDLSLTLYIIKNHETFGFNEFEEALEMK